MIVTNHEGFIGYVSAIAHSTFIVLMCPLSLLARFFFRRKSDASGVGVGQDNKTFVSGGEAGNTASRDHDDVIGHAGSGNGNIQELTETV